MIILGIETSCDETSAAILKCEKERVEILSNIIGTSLSLQSRWGGVVPEQAAREQVKSIIPVIAESLTKAQVTWDDIDAIAVTNGPGLIGSLLVGVETAKTLALTFNKPLIPMNHLIGHFYANWIFPDKETSKNNSVPKFPAIGLLVSGGHTDLVLFKDHGDFEYLGGTRDDAAGECFDKCARLLGFPYPGGPKISKLAENGNPNKYKLPIPMMASNNFDFSFSGLKTAFSLLVEKHFKVMSLQKETAENAWKQIVIDKKLNGQESQIIADMCASLEEAIIKSLVTKTIKAVAKYQVNQIIVAGGVAANQKLRDQLELAIKRSRLEISLNFPPPILCTDNGAMIASAAFFYNQPVNPIELQANPNLSLEII